MGAVMLVQDQLKIVAHIPQVNPMPADLIELRMGGMGRHILFQVLPQFHHFHIAQGFAQLLQTHDKLLLILTRSASFRGHRPAE